MKVQLTKYQGLDVRRLAEASDPRSTRVAINVDLTQGGEYESREPTEELMALDPKSIGLYALNGTLRAAAPGGQGVPARAIGPVSVVYDRLGIGAQTFDAIMVVLANSNQVRLQGAAWPAWAPGATLVAGTYTATVLGVSGDVATMSAINLSTVGLSAFTLTNGGNSLVSRTVALNPGSPVVTLAGGSWPLGLEGATFAVPGTTFGATIVSRNSNTQITLSANYTNAANATSVYTLAGLATAYPLNTLQRVTAVESIGASAAFGVYPYLCVERLIDAANPAKGRIFEHHWIRNEPPSTSTVVATNVPLPFSPGPALVKASGKIWAPDDVNGVVRFCSTANGPIDWVTPEDAGYIPVLTHASGDRRVRGLGIYDEKLAVIFSDAVQLWATDPQPTNITLVRVANGPGTTQPRSVVNVLGDLFYLTRGGYRSLTTSIMSGQVQERDDIGTPIDDLVQLETAEATSALWSQTRGQYLCAIGNRVYAYRYSPKTKVAGWTTWELPFTPTAMVELEGKLYFRSTDHKLHRMRADAPSNVNFTLRFNDFAAKDAAQRKRFDFIEVVQRGTCTVKFFTEPGDDSYYTDGPTISGTTVAVEPIYIGSMARTLGVQFTGTGPWRLAATHLTFIETGR